jgi:hypothetical protein
LGEGGELMKISLNVGGIDRDGCTLYCPYGHDELCNFWCPMLYYQRVIREGIVMHEISFCKKTFLVCDDDFIDNRTKLRIS